MILKMPKTDIYSPTLQIEEEISPISSIEDELFLPLLNNSEV